MLIGLFFSIFRTASSSDDAKHTAAQKETQNCYGKNEIPSNKKEKQQNCNNTEFIKNESTKNRNSTHHQQNRQPFSQLQQTFNADGKWSLNQSMDYYKETEPDIRSWRATEGEWEKKTQHTEKHTEKSKENQTTTPATTSANIHQFPLKSEWLSTSRKEKHKFTQTDSTNVWTNKILFVLSLSYARSLAFSGETALSKEMKFFNEFPFAEKIQPKTKRKRKKKSQKQWQPTRDIHFGYFKNIKVLKRKAFGLLFFLKSTIRKKVSTKRREDIKNQRSLDPRFMPWLNKYIYIYMRVSYIHNRRLSSTLARKRNGWGMENRHSLTKINQKQTLLESSSTSSSSSREKRKRRNNEIRRKKRKNNKTSKGKFRRAIGK